MSLLLLFQPGGVAYSLAAEPGSYVLTGHAATLTVTVAAVVVPPTETRGGGTTEAGVTFTPRHRRPRKLRVDAEPGRYHVAGHDAGLLVRRSLEAEAGLIALRGASVSLPRQVRVAADRGRVALAVHDATIEHRIIFDPNTTDELELALALALFEEA